MERKLRSIREERKKKEGEKGSGSKGEGNVKGGKERKGKGTRSQKGDRWRSLSGLLPLRQRRRGWAPL